MKSDIYKSVQHNEHIFVFLIGVGAKMVKNLQWHILLMPIFVQHFCYSNMRIISFFFVCFSVLMENRKLSDLFALLSLL